MNASKMIPLRKVKPMVFKLMPCSRPPAQAIVMRGDASLCAASRSPCQRGLTA